MIIMIIMTIMIIIVMIIWVFIQLTSPKPDCLPTFSSTTLDVEFSSSWKYSLKITFAEKNYMKTFNSKCLRCYKFWWFYRLWFIGLSFISDVCAENGCCCHKLLALAAFLPVKVPRLIMWTRVISIYDDDAFHDADGDESERLVRFFAQLT